MKNGSGLLKRKNYVAALLLIVLMSIPVTSFAFMNPNTDPQAVGQSLESEPVRDTDSPAIANVVNDDPGDAQDGGSVNNAGAILASGEIGLSDQKAALLSKTSGFSAFNSQQGNRWQATFCAETGLVKRLYGNESQAYSGSAENGARAFLKSAHALFGLSEDLSELKAENVSETPTRRHVSFQRMLNGVAILGSQVRVHADLEGRVTMVQSDGLGTIAVTNQDNLPGEAAKSIARSNLISYLGQQTTLSRPEIVKLIALVKGEYRYIWKVTTPTYAGPDEPYYAQSFGLWVHHVDAETGKILYRGNEIFYLTKGSGRAYIDNDEYYVGKTKNVKLEDLFDDDDGYVQGYLRGLRANIYDWNYDYAYSKNFNFRYDEGTEKPWFDQSHAYYQQVTIWEWWNKNVINKFGPEIIDHFYVLPVPTLVNVTLLCNAFYTPILPEPLNPEVSYLPGFAFGDEDSCPFPSEDLVIDNDVVRHEWAHAIMDWAGFASDDDQFGGQVDNYGRAMGEGNSDWYSYLYSNNPAVGTVFFEFFGPYGLRNIDNINRYPDDVDDPTWLSDNETVDEDNETVCPDAVPETPEYDGTPLPEEHYTGEIWGGYLYDLSRVLGKKALQYVYTSSFYFYPEGGHRDGYADFVDAIRAQFAADLDANGNYKQSFKAFGSMVSRGFIRALPDAPLYSHPCDYFGTGEAGTDERDFVYLSAVDEPLKLKTKSNMLVNGDDHEYPFKAKEGMRMTATVKGSKKGLKAPRISLYTIDGVLLEDLDFSENTSVTKATLSYTLPEDGMYVVRVTGSNASPRRGYYTFKLDAGYEY